MNGARSRISYPVVIAANVLPSVRDAIASHGTDSVVLCDAEPRIVALAKAIATERSGVFAFELGERRKRLSTVERVLETLATARCERSALIVGVGGGVAADLFGLAAALYMRGVDYMHVATSLVAMADAAIGGKTSVDLPSGKNLAGSFRDPIAVFAHVDALRTLPLRSVREGLAEIVKVAIVSGGELFETIEELAPHPLRVWPWPLLIASAVNVKRETVDSDPHDDGRRQTLNLGHTFGHAFERASEYRITHGAGVALGLRAAGILAMRLGRYSMREHLSVLGLIALLKMPLRTSVAASDALAAMAHDKKRRDGTMRFVLPNGIGDVRWGVSAPARLVRDTLELMRLPPARRG